MRYHLAVDIPPLPPSRLTSRNVADFATFRGYSQSDYPALYRAVLPRWVANRVAKASRCHASPPAPFRAHAAAPALPADLTACRIAYETGATFAALASQHGLGERTLRRMLHSVGIEARAPGRRARELPVDLILADHDGGMSARQIVAKHGLADHHAITRLLRSHGREPHHRGSSRGNRAIVLGAAVTSRQAFVRRRPPMSIPIRTPAERQCRRFTGPEIAAIEQALAAGRVQRADRGARGLPEVVGWQAAHDRAWRLFHGKQAA